MVDLSSVCLLIASSIQLHQQKLIWKKKTRATIADGIGPSALPDEWRNVSRWISFTPTWRAVLYRCQHASWKCRETYQQKISEITAQSRRVFIDISLQSRGSLNAESWTGNWSDFYRNEHARQRDVQFCIAINTLAAMHFHSAISSGFNFKFVGIFFGLFRIFMIDWKMVWMLKVGLRRDVQFCIAANTMAKNGNNRLQLIQY